ncbi:MAG TPA: hypothetical protein ENH29_10330 [Bacteroidetes bacterium]|nr:hypothetical protein [Bacteroidota bacterium]
MKSTLLVLILFFGSVAIAAPAQQNRSVSGKITFIGKITGKTIVYIYRLQSARNGAVRRLSKRDIYGAKAPFQTGTTDETGFYRFTGLPAGNYSLLAWIDQNQNNHLDFDPPEPFGWYAAETGGNIAVIDLTKEDRHNLQVKFRIPASFSKEEKRTKNGRLIYLKELPVLQLWGSPQERGFAHGFLIGRQILDFFEFYILEDSWKSPPRYQKIFVPFLESGFNYPAEFLQECDAVIHGMKAANLDMRIESLGRDFSRTDLIAINAYIEKRAAFPVAPPSSCSQFAFWGDPTEGTSLQGGLIAARNMDGECDVRKVTVSHFLIFAVDPQTPGKQRWVSMMWPGFVGTISGINESGLYGMENAGSSKQGPVVGGNVPYSWTERFVLETQTGKSTPESVLKVMQKFTNEAGGITSPGSIILWTLPYTGQKTPAFVYEGNRFGGGMRLPGETRPENANCIMATNHHLKYGYDIDKPGQVFGKPVSFSSRRRYETGMNTVEAWSRLHKKIDVADVKRLLQMVAHGSTEYSVIFLANQKKILVAVDDLKTDLWDAPYLHWTEFRFDEFFSQK